MTPTTEAFLNAMSIAFTVVKWFSIGLIILVAFGGFLIYIKRKRRFIYSPEIWGNSGGLPEIIEREKARPVKVQVKQGISSLLFLKKLKRYIKLPDRNFIKGKKIRFWFRGDGELIPIKPIKISIIENITGRLKEKTKEEMLAQAKESEDIIIPACLEDVETKFVVIGVKLVNEDARLAHVYVNRIVEDMFDLKKWLDKYGTHILMILGLLIFAISLILIIDGLKEYYGGASSIGEANTKLIDRMDALNEKTLLIIEGLNKIEDKYNPPIAT